MFQSSEQWAQVSAKNWQPENEMFDGNVIEIYGENVYNWKKAMPVLE